MSHLPQTLDEARKAYPPIFTIYDHPRDYPEYFVVRVFYGPFADRHWATTTLDFARLICEEYGASVCLPRDPSDDPVIVESWI